jgi:hypothetical protein
MARISSAFNHNETVEKSQQQITFLRCGKANQTQESLTQIVAKRSQRISQQKATAGDPLEILIIVDLSQLTDLFLLWIYPTPLDIPSHFGAIHSGEVVHCVWWRRADHQDERHFGKTEMQ